MDESWLREQLARVHAESFGWALSCCSHHPAEAGDVLQTAYLKVLQGRARFDGRASFKTWFFAVIRYTAADERRRHWLRGLRLDGYAKERETVPGTVDPDRSMEAADRRQVFEAALARLPRRQREVLHLVFYQDLTLQAAAEVMNVSVGSARTHYERGKRRLRDWLGGERTS